MSTRYLRLITFASSHSLKMNFKYSANIGFLWDNLPLPQRISAAASAGFDAVECHFPYEYPSGEIKAALEENGLSMLGLNTSLGPQGCFGLAAVAGHEAQAQQLIDQAIGYAVDIDAGNINVVGGLTNGDAAADKVYQKNLSYACDRAAEHGKTIVIEPLNARAVAGYHFSTVEHGVRIIDAVDKPNLKLMFDFFHAQIVEGDLESLIRQYAKKYFGHVQISAVHDRGEPDEGEINYPYVLNALSAAGYDGYIGAEYKPRGESVEAGASWLEHFRC